MVFRLTVNRVVRNVPSHALFLSAFRFGSVCPCQSYLGLNENYLLDIRAPNHRSLDTARHLQFARGANETADRSLPQPRL